jgi:hypothetical protein
MWEANLKFQKRSGKKKINYHPTWQAFFREWGGTCRGTHKDDKQAGLGCPWAGLPRPTILAGRLGLVHFANRLPMGSPRAARKKIKYTYRGLLFGKAAVLYC